MTVLEMKKELEDYPDDYEIIIRYETYATRRVEKVQDGPNKQLEIVADNP